MTGPIWSFKDFSKKFKKFWKIPLKQFKNSISMICTEIMMSNQAWVMRRKYLSYHLDIMKENLSIQRLNFQPKSFHGSNHHSTKYTFLKQPKPTIKSYPSESKPSYQIQQNHLQSTLKTTLKKESIKIKPFWHIVFQEQRISDTTYWAIFAKFYQWSLITGIKKHFLTIGFFHHKQEA